MQRIRSRPILSEADFWRVRDLLSETVSNTPSGFNWNVRRWDGSRFHDADTDWVGRRQGQVQLWETDRGQLVGAVFNEGDGDAHLQVHPHYRYIEEEMVVWAEANLAVTAKESSQRRLDIFVYEYDKERQRLLSERGYGKTTYFGVTRWRHFDNPILAKPEIASGYTLRTTCPEELTDCQRIADLLNAAFGRDFHTAEDYRNFALHAPSFRLDLDLVAEAADGSFASYVGVPYDDPNRLGIFEPVCTHPDHRRRGLARVLMLEGLRRLQALGANSVIVDTGDMIPANRLYDAIGFSEVVKGYVWRRSL
jgi:ribosomal protein S18 acetylase RimI-like enzyme